MSWYATSVHTSSWGRAKLGSSPSPPAGSFPSPSYRKRWNRELLLTWLRGNWKSWLSYETHVLKWRTVGEESGALWGGLWLRKKDFSTCVVHLSFCNVSHCHGKHLFFPGMAGEYLTQAKEFVCFLCCMASPIICWSLVILCAVNSPINPLTTLTSPPPWPLLYQRSCVGPEKIKITRQVISPNELDQQSSCTNILSATIIRTRYLQNKGVQWQHLWATHTEVPTNPQLPGG